MKPHKTIEHHGLKPSSHLPILKPDTVVVLLAHLNSFYPQLQTLRSILSPAEQQRANRFHFEKHQQRFTVSQSLLRLLVAHYTEQSATQLEFSKNAYGKPFIQNSPVKFNMSHSNEYALYAFVKNSEVGVDLEHWRDRKYLDGIIDSNFSKLEQKLYHGLAKKDKVAGFYQGWTCNEAYIKAIGMGLSYPLKAFSVEMDPHKPAQLLATTAKEGIKTHWHIQKLPCPENYSAAIALDHAEFTLQYAVLEYDLLDYISSLK